MKKLNIALMCIAAIACVACGNKKSSKSATEVAEKVEAQVEAQDAFTGDNYSKEAVEFWAKKQYGLSMADITPDCKYNENPDIKTFYAVNNTLVASFLDDDAFTVEEIDALAEKLFNATKAIADNGINIYGWESKDVAEEANAEKSLEEVLAGGHNLFSDYSWYFIKDGIYMVGRVSSSNRNDKHILKAELNRGLQKSFSDSMAEVEKALEDEEVQKAIKEAVK